MKKTKQLLSLILLLVVGAQNIAFGSTKAEPLFNKTDYLPNDTEAQIEANSMKWFEERVKFVKENIKMLPNDFMEDWSWDKPLTRIEFLVLMTPIRTDFELTLNERNKIKPTYIDLEIINRDIWIKKNNEILNMFNDELTNSENIYKSIYAYNNDNYLKGPDIYDDTILLANAQKIADRFNVKIPNPLTNTSYSKFKEKHCANNIPTCDYLKVKYFNPDNYLNFAEVATATVRQTLGKKYYQVFNITNKNTLKGEDVSNNKLLMIHKINRSLLSSMEVPNDKKQAHSKNNWYQAYIKDIQDIKGLSSQTKLEPSDIPNTKQTARIMFMSLFNSIENNSDSFKNNSWFYNYITWGEFLIDCNSEKLQTDETDVYNFYCKTHSD